MILLGNKRLLDEKLAVVLNSSQSKTPCGKDRWITQTISAVSQLLSSGFTIITSMGLSTWELPVYAANISGGNQIIISPVFDDANGESIFAKTIKDFALNPDKTAMLFVKPDEGARSPKANWLKRDQAALSLAHKIAPIAIRPGGRIEGLLNDDSIRPRCINDYKIEFEKPLKGPEHYQLNIRKEYENWNFITHWTKTCHGPWPGESKGAYYARLISSGDRCPGHPLETLRNIIAERKIRASSSWMREGRLAIGFTEANPAQALSLMRWYPKRVNWNFEPFGVAIDKEIALQLGVRPVIYGEEAEYAALSDEDKPYFQSLGGTDVDWRREREWRHIGDLEMKDIPKDKIIYLVWEHTDMVMLGNKVSELIMAVHDD